MYRNVKCQTKIEFRISQRTDGTPLLWKNWSKRFKLTIGTIESAENSQSEREKRFNRFSDLVENNETKVTEINIHFKPRQYPVKQKARPVSKPDHERSLFDFLRKLEKADHRANKRKFEFCKNQTKWL